jgi:hypothetical protein
MLITRHKKDHGIFFALWPRRTPEGLAVGWLHYEWVPSWGWGSEGHYRYANWVSDKEYDAGRRRNFGQELPYTLEEHTYRVGDVSRTDRTVSWEDEQRRLRGWEPPYYSTPPDPSKCRNRDLDPTPCHHPHCSCMNVGGSTCPVK